MLRFFVLVMTLLITTSVQAGELEDAVKNNNYTFLYIYAPWCGACSSFTPMYNNLQKKYGNKYAFVKLNTDTKYGNMISYKYNVRYVPYVALFKRNSFEAKKVPYDCIVRKVCAEKVLEDFAK